MIGGEALSAEQSLDILCHGELEMKGLVPWSSNYTFMVAVRRGEMDALAVYKPQEGETPLWDFDSGTLCLREVAAYTLSTALGFPNVPPVVLREGPYGLGSLQIFVTHSREAHYLSLKHRADLRQEFQRIALFDYLVNNADRKGGHVLLDPDGRVWAIDHGLTFHQTYKLRTVIWDWSGEPVPKDCLPALERLDEALARRAHPYAELLELLSAGEIEAIQMRIGNVLSDPVLPRPRRASRNIPYPLV
jgi:hypothetical protein